MIKILIQEVPFQPELKNEIQQLVETELFSHFKKVDCEISRRRGNY